MKNPPAPKIPAKEAPVVKTVKPWGERHRGEIKKSK